MNISHALDNWGLVITGFLVLWGMADIGNGLREIAKAMRDKK